MITFDRSERTTLVLCSCGHRQLLATTDRGPAWTAARDHERRAHPDRNQASNGLSIHLRRAGS